MTQLAVTVIGPDRPGIVAEVTAALAGAGVNLEDSTMTLLRGHFAMMLVCSGPGPGAVERAVEPLSGELVVTVREIGPERSHAALGPAREGCLSVPDLTGDVRRATRLAVAGQLPGTGQAVTVATDGFEARAMQHELDHCAGLLFLDRVAGAHAVFARKVYL